MPPKVNIGDKVYVPISVDARLSRYSFALCEAVVIDRNPNGRSIQVKLPSGDPSNWIATSKTRKNSGILIINIGDLNTEVALLDPLSKSILQFCRLLLTDDFVRSVKLRSIDELEHFWNKENMAYRYVIFIGHGQKDGVLFGVNKLVETEEFFQLLNDKGSTEKIFLSLCCETGYKQFAGKLSELPYCESFIAPLNEVNGAIASQFCQSFLNHHLLYGHSTVVAFKKTLQGLNNKKMFRLWRKGKLGTIH